MALRGLMTKSHTLTILCRSQTSHCHISKMMTFFRLITRTNYWPKIDSRKYIRDFKLKPRSPT